MLAPDTVLAVHRARHAELLAAAQHAPRTAATTSPAPGPRAGAPVRVRAGHPSWPGALRAGALGSALARLSRGSRAAGPSCCPA